MFDITEAINELNKINEQEEITNRANFEYVIVYMRSNCPPPDYYPRITYSIFKGKEPWINENQAAKYLNDVKQAVNYNKDYTKRFNDKFKETLEIKKIQSNMTTYEICNYLNISDDRSSFYSVRDTGYIDVLDKNKLPRKEFLITYKLSSKPDLQTFYMQASSADEARDLCQDEIYYSDDDISVKDVIDIIDIEPI